MRARTLAHRWTALLLGAALLTTGCVTLAPRAVWNASATTGTPPLQPYRLQGARGLGTGIALAGTREAPTPRGMATDAPPSRGGKTLPPDWPDFSSHNGDALLAPFFTCTSPAEFVALQSKVDMPRLVETLEDWDAIRLGALGPVREDAARLLNRKRAAFIVEATENYGAAPAEVFVRFIADSSFDDDLREILFQLAQDKRLEATLGLMPRARAELEARGLKLSIRKDRDFQATDIPRGVGSALADMGRTAQRENALYTRYSAQRSQLPAPYQEDLDRVEREAAARHFSPGNVVAGGFDTLTFGVPLSFYYLAAGTGHGLTSLTRGQYEQATRELTPIALLAALYAGGKGMRSLSEVHETGTPVPGRAPSFESRLGGLVEVSRRLETRMGEGVESLRELVRDIHASREAGRFVAVGGVDAALALHEAKGDVARARPLMSRAKTGTDRPSSAPREARAPTFPSELASLVDEKAGLSREVVEAKLSAVELESTGPRLPRNVGVLEKQRPTLDAPPPEARGNPRWHEYVDYYEKRLDEVKEGTAAKGPLPWEAYEQMRGGFARGLAFEVHMVKLLEADASLPRAQRRFLGDFDKPRIERNVGVRKPGSGLRFADVLVIEEGELGGQPRRVETFSFKSRDLSGLNGPALDAQIFADAREALRNYGETLDIRRNSLQLHLTGGNRVQVPRVRLVYEGGRLLPTDLKELKSAVNSAREEVPGVEVLIQ